MTEQPLALIVDDEPDIRELLEITLSRMGVDCLSAENLGQAKTLLTQNTFDLCLTDMRLPDGNGIDLIRHIQQQYPDLPVAMITAHGNMESAIEALKAGAYDFVNKPLDINDLRSLVTTALKLERRPASKSPAEPGQTTLLGDSAVMQQIRQTIAKLARSQAPVYISGGSGVGKELAARLIHEQGPRRDQPFVPVNCGAIPAELMESEFFGHKKGSFTGANGDKAGLFQAAQGGTLFLDEVADLPLHMQVKLLRAIQEKAVRPIGSQQEIHTDVRILSASHKDLGQLIHTGEFRQDLYYRINVIELHLPDLAERPGDIPLLADHFLQRIAADWQVDVPRLSDDALQALQSYSFPGNVRELENLLERAMTLCEDNRIDAASLNLPANHTATTSNPAPHAAEERPLDNSLQEQEKEAIRQALEQTRYNKTAAARLLGLSFRQLRYRIKKLGIE
ncbi:sigma-54 dependent transcriptional regulator [Thiohalophilus sp.]|uniref:sigma-54-dependent transcriptional regulator n=1 Tax=Thiohalophilus sp. TaxID=3028392 RepID=UPI002ACEF8EC|nr:sigma-54 dependent transcriptional regulator [Thiohalophilus sp.]MDZ7662343.1 sigma-54 dependent transcriptional regulator [Thiohalophilus sp.]MDZ7802426.1 sigma-54 dependent transcriptional regulator [Thiohalophilus sp.]